MFVIDEVKEQQKKIFAYMNYVEKLEIKLFYERNRTSKTEYEKNENEISIIITEIKLNKIKATLDYLIVEHNESLKYLVSLSNEENE